MGEILSFFVLNWGLTYQIPPRLTFQFKTIFL